MFKLIIIAADTKHWCRHKAKGLTETLTRWGKREAQWRRRKTACHLQGTTTKPYTKWTTQHMSNGICIIIIIYILFTLSSLDISFIRTCLLTSTRLLTYNRFVHQLSLQFCADSICFGHIGPSPKYVVRQVYIISIIIYMGVSLKPKINLSVMYRLTSKWMKNVGSKLVFYTAPPKPVEVVVKDVISDLPWLGIFL